MEHTVNIFTPEAATDEPASCSNPGRAVPPPEPPSFEPPPLLSDSLDEAIAETLDATFTPETPRPRHDGWTPEAIAAFLRQLAAGGVVEHAARAAGMSAAAAYAFRNRRQGRAFARMWDAVLVHRSRARLASELQSRAIAGCVSVRRKDGVVVGEYHYYDNRLANALLTRLDRLAEREEGSDAHLRVLSEDLDDYLECLATGGDGDAFVEARARVAATPESPPASAGEADDDPDLTLFARVSGVPDYRDVDPHDIEVRDLDPTLTADWDDDQWVRAFRSGFMLWLEMRTGQSGGLPPGPGAALAFHVKREAACAAANAKEGEAHASGVDTSGLDPARILDWSDDQRARAWRGGLLASLSDDFWDRLADDEDEE